MFVLKYVARIAVVQLHGSYFSLNWVWVSLGASEHHLVAVYSMKSCAV